MWLVGVFRSSRQKDRLPFPFVVTGVRAARAVLDKAASATADTVFMIVGWA